MVTCASRRHPFGRQWGSDARTDCRIAGAVTLAGTSTTTGNSASSAGDGIYKRMLGTLNGATVGTDAHACGNIPGDIVSLFCR